MKVPQSDPAPAPAPGDIRFLGFGESSGSQQKRDRASSPGRDVAGVDTTSEWTGEKKTRFQSSPTSVDVDMTAQDASEEDIEGLDWDDDMLREEIDYYTTHYRGLPPDDDEEAWELIDDQQLRDLNIRLAICRLKYHKMLEGQELSDAELREMYPPSTLEENGYFEQLECDFEWYFDPEKCQFAHLQDYQRLALRSNVEYGYADWEFYHSIGSPPESDEEFVQFWEKLSSKTKWIKNFVHAESSVWERMQRVAFYHAAKIARGLPNIFSPLRCRAFTDYISSVTFDNTIYVYHAHLYLEIWKLVAKHKMNFEDALNQVKDNKDIYIWCRLQVEADIRSAKWFWPGSFRRDYDTYMADISDDLTDAEAYKLVMEAVKKIVPKHKSYYDYAKKKLDIAEKIGLITPHSTQKLNVAEKFRGHSIYCGGQEC